MEGLVKCRTCYGRGYIKQYMKFIITKMEQLRIVPCPTCHSTGTVFWIDEACGRNKKRRKRQIKKLKRRNHALV